MWSDVAVQIEKALLIWCVPITSLSIIVLSWLAVKIVWQYSHGEYNGKHDSQSVLAFGYDEVPLRVLAGHYSFLKWFVGDGVGLKQEMGPQGKLLGQYLCRLMLFYWISGSLLVSMFLPLPFKIHEFQTRPVLGYQMLALVMLLTSNVVLDSISIMRTKYNLWRIVENQDPVIGWRCVLHRLADDIAVATCCFLCAQLISNLLYPIQIGDHHNITTYIWPPENAIKTAFAPYGWRTGVPGEFDASLSFPGQILISSTSYVPTFAIVFITVVFLVVRLLYGILSLGAIPVWQSPGDDAVSTVARGRLVAHLISTVTVMMILAWFLIWLVSGRMT